MNMMGHNSQAFGEALRVDLEQALGGDEIVQFRHIDWHIGDWMGGTLGMSCEHEGAYCRFLNRLYQRGKPLPDDDRFMATVMGLSIRVWRRLRDVLVEAGKIIARAGCLTNSRFEKERLKQAERLRNAAAAARARWSNPASLAEVSTKFAPSLAETSDKLPRKAPKKVNEINDASDAAAMPYQSQSLTPIKEDSPNGELSPAPQGDLLGGGDLGDTAPKPARPAYSTSFEEFWKLYPHRKGKGAASKSWEKLSYSEKRRVYLVLRAHLPALESKMNDPSGGNYCPMPATWLNEKRYDDEVEQPKKQQSGSIEKHKQLYRHLVA
jgi:uncharacterized protein YdaU (DUF1376 family)